MSSDLPAGWTPTTLGDHAEVLAGFAFKSAEFSSDPNDVRLLRGDNVGHGRLRWINARRWPRDRRAEFERYELREGDVVLAMDRPWIEAGLKYGVVRGEDLPCLLVQRVARLRAHGNLAQEYLRYIVRSPAFTQHVRAVQTGTAVPHISGAQISAFAFRLPPSDEQARIASLLCAIDNRIDSNRRLATLLEAMVATVFRGRFVDQVPGADGDGRLRDRKTGALSDLADIASESVQPSAAPETPFEHFSIPAFDAGAEPEVALGAAILSGKTRIPDREVVLLSKLNPRTKRVWWPRPSGAGEPVCSSEFLVLVPRVGIPTSYLYTAVNFDDRFYGELLSHVTGTTGSRQRVKPHDALACAVVVPSSAELQEFDAFARPLLDLAHGARAENRTLAATRDTLLPRLISGAIRLPQKSDMEKAVPLAATGVTA